jgi:hypothetical protein
MQVVSHQVILLKARCRHLIVPTKHSLSAVGLNGRASKMEGLLMEGKLGEKWQRRVWWKRKDVSRRKMKGHRRGVGGVRGSVVSAARLATTQGHARRLEK